MTNSDRKRAIRARMAETGENYTRALRALQAERALPPPGWQLVCPDCKTIGGDHAEGCESISIPRLTNDTGEERVRDGD